MLYRYHAFGLQIDSEIECPQLLAGERSMLPPDVHIRAGAVPHELENALYRGTNYQIETDRFLLHIAGVARYLVSSGCEILVEPYLFADFKDVRLFLLGSAMGALLHQRGIWPLHGSAVASGGGAVIFMGASGSGKSTLAGAFYQRGFQALSDDVSAITTSDNGIAQVWAAYPRLSLWADAVVRLGSDPAQLQLTHTSQEKYDFPLTVSSSYSIPVRSVYSLYTADQDIPYLQPLKGFDKVQELTTHTYRLHFLTGMQLQGRLFQQAATLAQHARVVRVVRPSQPFLLEKLVDLIERDLFT